ncbi:Hnrnpa0 [Symbiodinium natans]|uniref:Hnrnpa0 protein n=1 Tax=Symbiodinium natans TaxID=878477 RepID=A0A812RAI1_9DINO|nr:Hnrnpa0 [Symbiodinium natans]
MSNQRNHKADRRRRSGGEMVQTPVHIYNEDAPATPCKGSPQQKALVGSPSPETLCPQPRRPFPNANATAPSLEQLASVPGTEEAACNKELKELWSGSWKGAATPGRLPWENRPLSSVSTSAGATPGLDDQCSRLQFSPAPSSAAPTPSQEFDRYNKTVPPSQVRKIFVGGIPQDFTQDDLGELFSQFGAVTKAWLQRHRQSDNEFGQASAQRSQCHRGFGFVIFQDACTVDDLLGPESSCFMEIKDGRRIEVKRAKSSNDIIGERQVQPEPKQAWPFQHPRGDQQQLLSQPQPPQAVQKPHIVPCASLNCGNVQGGGWPMVWTGSVATSRAVLPPWGGSGSQAGSQAISTDNAPGRQAGPPSVDSLVQPAARTTASTPPQMMCGQVPPFSFPWAAGPAQQSEEDRQKLVRLLQAAAPEYYAD